MDTPRPEPLVYRVAEVCDLLALSRAAVYRLIAAGQIPVLRFGRSVRIPAWWVHDRTNRRVA